MGASPPGTGDCTTHFNIIDKEHNMVSCTQTIAGGFGYCVVIPGTGVLISNGMVVFNPVPGTPNSIAGYKAGLNNMGPVLALRNGRPFLSLGAPGGRRLISRLSQVLVNVMEFGQRIQEAISAPTVDVAERETFVDYRISGATVEGLRRMGHNVVPVPGTLTRGGFARPGGALVNPETGRIHGGVQVTGIDEARGY